MLPPGDLAKLGAWVAEQPLQNETAAMLAEVLALAAVVRCAADGQRGSWGIVRSALDQVVSGRSAGLHRI